MTEVGSLPHARIVAADVRRLKFHSYLQLNGRAKPPAEPPPNQDLPVTLGGLPRPNLSSSIEDEISDAATSFDLNLPV